MTRDSAYCSGCGYELAGLSHAGNCPECGQAYDIGLGLGVASDASSRSERGEFLMRRVRTIVLGVVTLGIVGLTALAASLTQSGKPIMWGALFVALFALATITSFLYEKPED